jgi:hypothetical protein
MTRGLGADHWRVAAARYNLGLVLLERGKRVEARSEIAAAHSLLLQSLGPDHPRTRAAADKLAELDGAKAAALRTGR